MRTLGARSVLTMLVLTVAAGAQEDSPSSRRLLVRIETEPHEIQQLHDLGLDVWDYDADGTVAEVRVSASELDDLRARGFDPIVIDADVYATIAQRPEVAGTGEPWTHYHTLESAYEFLDDLAAAHSQRAKVFTAGYSYEGRPIKGIRIGRDSAAVDETKPAVFVVGCHHAREWISVEVPLYIAHQLLQTYDSDAQVRSLVDRGEVWIVPILNPDGLVHTHDTDRLWRNNRHPFGNGRTGVDLNRNYGFQWGHSQGSSGVVGTSTYRGAAPFSEPETRAVRSLFETRHFAGALSFHSYGQFVLAPWGYTYLRPPNDDELLPLVDDMAVAMNDMHDNRWLDYASGRIASTLYIASGVFEDWVYGLHGVPAVLIELRPFANPRFLLPPEEILPTSIESFEATLAMIERVFGPETYPAGDFDGSTRIDRPDHVFLTACLTGPDARPPGFPLGCHAADLTGDGRIDLADLAALRTSRIGSTSPWPENPRDLTDPR